MATGEVAIQLGQGLQVFGITGVSFDNAAAVPGLLVIDSLPPSPSDATQGPGMQCDCDGIGVINTNGLPVGNFSLGIILLPDFRAEAALADFVLRFDSPGNSDPQNAIDSGNVFFVNAIPEPSSLGLLALAGLGAVARRR